MKPNRACKHLFLAPLTGLVSPAVMIFVSVLVFHVWALCARGKLFWGCFGVLCSEIKPTPQIITSLVSFSCVTETSSAFPVKSVYIVEYALVVQESLRALLRASPATWQLS